MRELVDIGHNTSTTNVENFSKFSNQPIKSSSPFISIFAQLYHDVMFDIELLDEVGQPNILFSQSLVEMIMAQFIPYCFLWSGLVLRGTGRTRLTSCYLDKFIKRKKDKSGMKNLPANYAMSTLSFTRNEVSQYCEKYSIDLKKNKEANQVENGKFSYLLFYHYRYF